MTIRPLKLRLLLTSVLVSTSLCAGAVAAAGFWTVPGTGARAAGTATPRPVVLFPGTGGAALHPGGQGDVRTNAFNPNDFPVKISRVVLDTSRGTGGLTIDTNHPRCPVSAFSLPSTTTDTRDLIVQGNTSVALHFGNYLKMSPSAPSACQGAIVTVHLSAVVGT